MSNCDLCSGSLALPLGVVARHGVENGDDLPHHRYDSDLRSLSGCGQAIVEDLERRIATTADQGRHVEHASDGRASTPDTTGTFQFAALEVIWGKANEGGDLLAAHLSELREQSDDRAGQQRTHTRHRSEQPIALSQSGIGGDD